jgi:hypothetical protein
MGGILARFGRIDRGADLNANARSENQGKR